MVAFTFSVCEGGEEQGAGVWVTIFPKYRLRFPKNTTLPLDFFFKIQIPKPFFGFPSICRYHQTTRSKLSQVHIISYMHFKSIKVVALMNKSNTNESII